MYIQNSIYTLQAGHSYQKKFSSAINFKAASPTLSLSDIPEAQVIQSLTNQKNFTSKNQEGNTILHEAVRAGYFSAVKFLLTNPQRAKDLLNAQNNNGETALDLAQDDKIKKFLIAKHAKSGQSLPKETAQTVSARIQVQEPDLMNVFGKKTVQVPRSDEGATTSRPENEVSRPALENEQAPKKTDHQQPIAGGSFLKAESVAAKSMKVSPSAHILSAPDVGVLPPELANFTPLKILPGDPKSFDDVIGLNEIKEELNKDIVIPLTQAQAGKMLDRNKINLPNGILLVSPVGNGKTHLAKALAAEAKLPVVELTDLQNLNELSSKIEKIYKKEHRPIILFIRGMENFVEEGHCSSRNCNHFARNLTQAAKRGILIVATSTDKSAISKNILVPGIIDKVFKINPPDTNTRAELIIKYFDGKPVFEELNNPKFIKSIAEHTAGFSVAQLQHVISETARTAAATGVDKVSLPEILSEIKEYSKEQDIPEINEFNKTSMYDSVIKREQYRPGDPQKLDDIGGMKDIKEKITEKIIEPWKNKDEMDKFGIGMPDGVLLYGPPGSGKTYLIKGVARELGLPLYILNLSDVASSFRHQTTKNIKDIVNQLTEKYKLTGEASVLFLDELDSLGKSKENGSSADTDEVNTLLQEFNNAGDKGIILLAATNKLDNIEAALARDGRLGERIFVGYGDYESRLDMIKTILSSKPVTTELANNSELMEKLAQDFEDMPSSSIAKVLKEATYQMAIKGQSFEESVKTAFENYKEKELDDHLTKKGVKDRGRYLQLSKNSTIKYDTTYDRTFLKDNEPQNFSELAGMQDVKAQLKKHIIDMWQPEVI